MTRDFGGQNTGLLLNLKLESTLLRTLNKIRSTFNALTVPPHEPPSNTPSNCSQKLLSTSNRGKHFQLK